MNASTPLSLVLADCSGSVAAERAIWELATRLPRARFEPRVWLASDPAQDPFAAALALRDVPVDRMPAPGAAFSFRRVFDVWSRLRRARPEVLHLHFSWPTASAVAGGIADVSGVRHRIVTVHGGRDPESSRDAASRVLERAEIVTTACDAFAEQLARETDVPRERMRRVPAGIDAPEDAREAEAALDFRGAMGAGPLRPLWVFAGRLEPHRGADVLVESLGILRERGLPFVAAIVGDGPERAALERRIDELNLTTSIHVVAPPDDIRPCLAAADAVVVPSRWDGASAVLLEALARGRPLIASAVGGAIDAVDNGHTGRLVPPGDARALADALESFHRRPDAATRLGREAARRVLEDHEWDRVVEAYEAVYDEVLGLASFVPDAVARGRW